MAKRSGSDNSGMSMLALVNQVLIDGKVHTIKQISEHMQKYMLKGMSPERAQENVKLMLDNHSQVEKTPKGYRLKSGSNLTDVVREVLADTLVPVSEKDIIRLVAKKQGVPVDMIRLELDEDHKITAVTYSSRKFYYLAHRKQINEKVYRLLKNRNRAMTVDDIYESMETDEGFNRGDVIFLPREDMRIKKTANKYAIKKKEKPKVKTAEPRHLVNRSELEKVIDFLKENGKRMTALDLSNEVLGIPLDQTNLRFKLARDTRIKRADDLFYYDVVQIHKQVPEKVKEKIGRDYFKVKARMMGSAETHTVSELLDRVYSVNLATQDYPFYQQELKEWLVQDDETVLLLDDGWIHRSNEPRATWIPPRELSPVRLPSPPSPLPEEKLTPAEKVFLEQYSAPVIGPENLLITIPVTPADRKHGIVRLSENAVEFFPSQPPAYEIVLDMEDEDEIYESFVLTKARVIRGLEQVYADRLSYEGGKAVFAKNKDNSYRFNVKLEKLPEPFALSLERMNQLSEMGQSDWLLPDLVRALFRTSKNKFMSCYQIWLEVNVICQASPEDILATLKDFNCFLPIKSMEGYYSFDSSRGLSRLSVREDAVAPAVEEPVLTEVTELKEEVVEHVLKDAEPDRQPVETQPEKVKPKQKPRKEALKKRRKEHEGEPEELPDHLQKLKEFERKLPRLKTAARSTPDAETPVKRVERPVRIGAVSPGRAAKSRMKTAVRVTEEIPVLLTPPPMPKEPQKWDTTTFVNPQRGKGYAELQTTLEILKSFVSRIPEVRRTDGSIVIFLDNDVAVYFRIPPENQECWMAWIPDQSLNMIQDKEIWLKADSNRAKRSENGYWWATDRFRGPKGNYRDKNVLPGVEIVGKLLELMEQK